MSEEQTVAKEPCEPHCGLEGLKRFMGSGNRNIISMFDDIDKRIFILEQTANMMDQSFCTVKVELRSGYKAFKEEVDQRFILAAKQASKASLEVGNTSRRLANLVRSVEFLCFGVGFCFGGLIVQVLT